MKISILYIIIVAQSTCFAQINCDTLNRRHTPADTGILIKNTFCFKNFAVLLQDTCVYSNRFRGYDIYFDNKRSHAFSEYPALIVDTVLMTEIEQYIKSRPLTKKMQKELRNYIRLYIGCIDENGDTCVVVQFVTPAEYKKDKLYAKQLNLLARPTPDLRFAIFVKRKEDITMTGSFPKYFLSYE